MDLRVCLSLLAFVLSFGAVSKTFQFSWNTSKDTDLSVLSYNTRVFGVYGELGGKGGYKETKQLTKWLVDGGFDIMCFQEFYYEPNRLVFNSIRNLKSKVRYRHFFFKTFTNHVNGQFGMAIFSRFPILASGSVDFDAKSNNQVIYVDLKIKGDTVRVYNSHLHSNSLGDSDVPSMSQNSASNKNRLKNLWLVLKRGFGKRARQVDNLVLHIKKCKYKVVLCGDLNEIPYSYTYRQLDKMLDNAFEEKGSGFGFTFNGRIPFLRIDNIFVSEGIAVSDFKTKSGVKFSDHYPVVAKIRIKN